MEQISFNKEKELSVFWTEGRSKVEINAIQESIKRAVGDIMARTLSVKEGAAWSLKEQLSSEDGTLVSLFTKYFKEPPFSNECEFDRWHRETSKQVLAILEAKYEQVYYGKAQKILNMTFKNLYCTQFGANDEYFKFCHMPFDSYTLEWAYRSVYPLYKDSSGNALTKGKTPSWSNLYSAPDQDIVDGKYTYEFLTARIRQYFEEHQSSITVLQGEFVIWKNIQLEMAADGFYSQLLANYDENGKKAKLKEYRAKELTDKITAIREFLALNG